jgi:hypothetical protein
MPRICARGTGSDRRRHFGHERIAAQSSDSEARLVRMFATMTSRFVSATTPRNDPKTSSAKDVTNIRSS